MSDNNTKNALILGGSQGLGFASAKELAKRGFNLYIIHRDSRANAETLNKKFQDLRSYSIEIKNFNFDATRQDKTEKFVDELPKDLKFDLVLHSIAKGNLKDLYGENALNSMDFQITIQAMAISFHTWASCLVNNNRMQNPSQFLAFTSEGNSKVIPQYAAVSAAKSSLESIMRQMAVEYASLGIRTNCIQAGLVDTQALQHFPSYEKLKSHTQKRNPFHRLTQPEDVANVVGLLSEKAASWINGTVVKVDGGESLV
ncbi:SDR family oxidoreductase [Psychroflexus aestuariivivens]|uniref:SDR family oxidoreductase n=1 Tax=Psychroflexus aestuariivivens TaxID=1795040 RepID=UPI000FDB7115|nr:SDR family oxidoreductase [Psychroflexus aestuariivivens]